MEELLVCIGEYVITEFKEVDDIKYVTPDLGYKFTIVFNNGKKVTLSLKEEN